MKKILKIGLISYIMFILIIYVLSWTNFDVVAYALKSTSYGQIFRETQSTLPFMQRCLGQLLNGIMAALEISIALFLLNIIIKPRFEHIARFFQKISYLFFAYTLLDILFEPLYSLLITYHLGKGNRLIYISLSTEHLKYFIAALFFLLLVEYARDAYTLQEEQDLTI